jgi:transaldolase
VVRAAVSPSNVPPKTEKERSEGRRSLLEQLKEMSTIVEDTGEIKEIEKDQPYAATTNPSLVYKAAGMEQYQDIVDEAVQYGKEHGDGDPDKVLELTRNNLFCRFGSHILDYVPGDVSTEVDARLSFDKDAMIATARQLIGMYEDIGVSKGRVLVKLATTWEGIQACRVLETEGIKTNMTLLFSLVQAVAAADAGAYLVSPFVGRVMDWWKARDGVDGYPADKDPGVLAVRNIYNYYKCHDIETIIMGASFRSIGEITELAGCDRLTISPKYIGDLRQSYEPLEQKLSKPNVDCSGVEKMSVDEATFRWMLNEDAMATEKLAEGIRKFSADLESLDAKLKDLLEERA